MWLLEEKPATYIASILEYISILRRANNTSRFEKNIFGFHYFMFSTNITQCFKRFHFVPEQDNSIACII